MSKERVEEGSAGKVAPLISETPPVARVSVRRSTGGRDTRVPRQYPAKSTHYHPIDRGVPYKTILGDLLCRASARAKFPSPQDEILPSPPFFLGTHKRDVKCDAPPHRHGTAWRRWQGPSGTEFPTGACLLRRMTGARWRWKRDGSSVCALVQPAGRPGREAKSPARFGTGFRRAADRAAMAPRSVPPACTARSPSG